ncbi:MAG: geranylgeranylglyceryl/heptaprenylglyceryl phosphate synthase [Candidatus Marinimicrobia bacterium]|nr:geranylgeranylglyceryl/heptaprenylglyceryl phosphate synthase [Candidatus Neomarinimicrobiota bacterium]|tara:strand:+ start:93 stop:797 length:705 start_codon:yes stop_codon:yes gene_type:complete
MTIFERLIKSNNHNNKQLIALLDPDKKNDESLKAQLEYVNNNNFCAVLIGGSLMMDSKYANRIQMIKDNTDLPLIGFPSSLSQINKNFDAVLFMSLLSGRNPHYLIGEHVLSAPIIYDFEIEAIPVGYILLDGGSRTSVEVVSNTRPLPMDKIDIVVAHALASQYLGHKFIYLECGSNSKKKIDLKLLSEVKKYIEIPIIVGGGIKNKDDISQIYKAGADFVVIGSMIEKQAIG